MKHKISERRQYVRISTVLPVEFFVADKNGKRITPWLQGFTCDIAKGGIQIFINDLWWGFWDRINTDEVVICARINLPFRSKPVVAKAKVAWSQQYKQKEFNRCNGINGIYVCNPFTHGYGKHQRSAKKSNKIS